MKRLNVIRAFKSGPDKPAIEKEYTKKLKNFLLNDNVLTQALFLSLSFIRKFWESSVKILE